MNTAVQNEFKTAERELSEQKAAFLNGVFRMKGALVDFVFFELLAEAFVADLEQLCCLGLIASCL